MRVKKNDRDWFLIEKEYLSGMTVKELSEKYKIPEKTIYDHLKRKKVQENIKKVQENSRNESYSQLEDQLTKQQIESKDKRYASGYADLELLTIAIQEIFAVKEYEKLPQLFNAKLKVWDSIWKACGLDNPEIPQKEIDKIVNHIIETLSNENS
jgi:transposase